MHIRIYFAAIFSSSKLSKWYLRYNISYLQESKLNLLTRYSLKFNLFGNVSTLLKTKYMSLRDQTVTDKRGNVRYLIERRSQESLWLYLYPLSGPSDLLRCIFTFTYS
jgi:hypothetical protein